MPDRRTVRAYIGLGANVGDPAVTLADAVISLDELPAVQVRGVSRLYATEPWGVPDQPEFRNAAVALEVKVLGTDAAAAALVLLRRLKTLERAAGRRRRRRWGPRELDLDLLVFGRHRISVERPPDARSIDAEADPEKAAKRLEVPHRDLGERLFVVAPLADLAPRLVPPGWPETVETRRRRLAASEAPGSVRVVGAWDPGSRSWQPVGDSASQRARLRTPPRPPRPSDPTAGSAAPLDRTPR
jgi:2-amino-4-hydroxy-6-hydroxymethyldihydropteridine diphosphokinase